MRFHEQILILILVSVQLVKLVVPHKITAQDSPKFLSRVRRDDYEVKCHQSYTGK